MSCGIDFGSILECFRRNFPYFFVTDFSMNLRWIYFGDFGPKRLPKTTPGGSKNSVPRRRFLVRLLLGHPGSERSAAEPHFGDQGSQKGAPERHFGYIFLHHVFLTCLQEVITAVTQKTWIKQLSGQGPQAQRWHRIFYHRCSSPFVHITLSWIDFTQMFHRFCINFGMVFSCAPAHLGP